MRQDLAELGNGWFDGAFSGPDGRTYARRCTRMARQKADELVHEGVPVVCCFYGWGRFVWHDGDDARRVWQEERPHVTTAEPTQKALSKHHLWHAGLWESTDGERVLYLTGHC